jgi:hypothetical protein
VSADFNDLFFLPSVIVDGNMWSGVAFVTGTAA